ncbi:phosphate ABC transporter permease subunit PstC [Pseudemcibacter aquimaris]|uniref:phosphate ABC transporter permease subunit PstC n=1 Tax=Pseudemcibacter aquimaris TaxID=2857064 RepID=UPI0020139BE5|nr:phosphate ABC transporter permease subunit PstC [Pseudemcibacter aquimaris]MCC3860218.1 phosphate ABC transporter permease subunit PstC [Pseudemcibacter aquimaris]WDU57543.1 phosphate ABC transporter permease subunit PstC [Pseudemcibacter aquimaris]
MSVFSLLICLFLLLFSFYYVGKKKSLQVSNGDIKILHSLPIHYGWSAGINSFIPGFIVLSIWFIFGNSILDSMLLTNLGDKTTGLAPFELENLLNSVKGYFNAETPDQALLSHAEYYVDTSEKLAWAFFLAGLGLSCFSGYRTLSRMNPHVNARNNIEGIVRTILLIFSIIAIITTIGIVFSLLFESIRFFDQVSITEFVFGTQWSPQTAIRADQVGSSGAFGAVPLFVGTMLITIIAMMIAGPIGLLSAIYMAEFSSKRVRKIAKPLLEILAGIPTVVYGFIAALVVAPFIRNTGELLGLEIASESALAAGIVMGVMIIPLISSLSDDVISVVPQNLREGSLGLGATKTETVLKVILPSALPGIVGALLLATSRAIGETMIVVMAAGMAANLTINPLEAVTTVTVQIVALLTGDQEFASAKTLSAFALGLALFVTTLALNALALYIVRKYREEYD